MSKFELNGMVYTQNDKGNRFFRIDAEGKKVRISEEEFTNAFDTYWENEGEQENAKRKAKASADDKAAENAVNKKARAPRKSKDIAWECEGITLTAKQVDFIRHIPDTCFYEDGLDSIVWCDVLADEIGGQFSGKPMTVGAMISTLREKKIVEVSLDKVNGKKAKSMSFTSLGKEIAKELGLK